MGSTEDVLRLLQGVFDLASGEKGSCCSILVLVFSVLVDKAELVVIDNCCAEGSNWSEGK